MGINNKLRLTTRIQSLLQRTESLTFQKILSFLDYPNVAESFSLTTSANVSIGQILNSWPPFL
jgi:hypothetical protein